MNVPPLILLHGALGDARQMKPVADLLPANERHYIVEFSGHGQAEDIETFSIRHFAQDVIAYMDKREVPVADLFGYSMGGYVAIQTAALHPERVRRILTLGTKFDWTPETAASEIRMLDPETIHQNVPSFAALLKKRHGARWPDVCRQTAEMLVRMGNGEALQLGPDLLDHPVQMCVGELDTMAGVAATRQAAEQLPGATLHVLPDVKHPIEKIDHELLTSLILVWRVGE
ncbi:MAG: alpha/beta hydrolase [Saprospiraceae bacterium]|nr:alpha/beta hydrolase [Saprospiraceae bacterium]